MATGAHACSLTPELRVARRTGTQRRHLPRARAARNRLLRAARLDERRGRRALEAGLPALRAALLASPWYRQRLAAAGLAPRDLRRLEDLGDFPTLDRPALAAHWTELPAIDAGRAGELVVVRSSGSTGQPLSIVRDEYECLHMWAVLGFWTRWLRLALPPRPRAVLLCALPAGIEYSTRLPILDDGALHRIAIVRGEALERLRRVAPAVLFSDPAGLHWLAGQPAPPRPRLLLSSAQHLSPTLRTRLARRLRAPLVNYYSTTETGPVAWECLLRRGRFHVLVPEVWVESLEGELVVTRLRPGPLPLLRYRTGDAGRVSRDDCPCGYRGWSILGFGGRHACWFRTPDGRPVDAWRLAWLFKHYPLDGFRLTQTGLRDFRLELCGERHSPGRGDLERRLRSALVRLGWSRPRLTLRTAIAAGGIKPEPFRGLSG